MPFIRPRSGSASFRFSQKPSSVEKYADTSGNRVERRGSLCLNVATVNEKRRSSLITRYIFYFIKLNSCIFFINTFFSQCNKLRYILQKFKTVFLCTKVVFWTNIAKYMNPNRN